MRRRDVGISSVSRHPIRVLIRQSTIRSLLSPSLRRLLIPPVSQTHIRHLAYTIPPKTIKQSNKCRQLQITFYNSTHSSSLDWWQLVSLPSSSCMWHGGLILVLYRYEFHHYPTSFCLAISLFSQWIYWYSHKCILIRIALHQQTSCDWIGPTSRSIPARKNPK